MELTRYLNRTNRQLSKFFTSILDQGSSLSLNENNQTGPFRELIHKLGEINNLIQLERRERKAEYTYLNYIIENIGVGVVTFKENGSIDLINPAAKKIFPEEILLNLSDLNKFNPEFERSIKALELNEGALIRIIVRNELFYLTVRKSLFKLHGDPIWLISFQDINSELDKKELESWQKIIRVLTHEIMSSISPVCSLSEHLLDKTKELYHTGVMEKAMEDKLEDLMEGLDIIKLRGDGLMKFVAHYHSLTHLPIPKLEEVQLSSILEKIMNLIKPECENNNISMILDVKENLHVSIDPRLIEQVILNLIRNSIQAFDGFDSQGSIWITASKNPSSGIQISVRDNGCGIDLDNMDNIFIPFYTTRDKGSGIGLSLAKQIMRLHNGQISVKSNAGKGAEFILNF
jgi:nitrogen fixation/metabolism regulation signal transduction histidine kinase